MSRRKLLPSFPSMTEAAPSRWALGIARNKLKLYYRQTAAHKRVFGDLAMSRLAEVLRLQPNRCL